MGAGRADDDDGKVGVAFLDPRDKVAAGHVADTGVEDNAVDLWERGQSFYSLRCAVGGDDVELGGFDDELTGGNATGVFAIDDEKAWPDHVFDYAASKAAKDSSLSDIVGVGDFSREALSREKVVVCGACRFESNSTEVIGKTGSGNRSIGRVDPRGMAVG